MRAQHKRNSKIIRFLNGKAFYVVLCLCFLGIGIAMWSGVEGLKNMNEQENTLSGDTAALPSIPQDTVLSPETDSSDTSSLQKPFSTPQTPSDCRPAEEASTNVATFFVKPMLGDVMKNYSDSELQYSMTFKDMRLHKGVDIAGNQGDPVCASGEGTVKDVFDDPLLGTVVVIDHGNGIVAKYCGLAKNPPVNKGDAVDSSVRIGALGDIPSESVEQYHLHLEFTQNGKSVDPLKFME